MKAFLRFLLVILLVVGVVTLVLLVWDQVSLPMPRGIR